MLQKADPITRAGCIPMMSGASSVRWKYWSLRASLFSAQQPSSVAECPYRLCIWGFPGTGNAVPAHPKNG
jgi:hypothetical protein